MFLSDSLPSEIRFRQAYTLSFYLSVMGRVSPVPNHTFHTYRFLYTEGFLRAAFQFLRFHPYAQGSASLCSLFRDLSNDTAEFTLCYGRRYGLHNCSPSYRGYFIHSLSTLHYCNAPSLATRLTGDYRDRTYLYLVVQLRWTHNVNERKTVQTNMISFVSHGDKTLQRLIGMPGEQEHHISSVPFFFS